MQRIWKAIAFLLAATERGRSAERGDLVSAIEYDGAGREYIQWLQTPIADNQGAFVKLNDFGNLARTAYADSRPFNETIFENSPLNRSIGKKGSGAAWNTHPTGVSYQTNGSEVANYIVNSSNLLERKANYTSGMLYKTTSTDEDGKTTTEYKDKLGQVIMKQSSSDVKTYYVYNDLGQLSYVIPPIAADNLTDQITYTDDDTNLKQFCYIYKYDERGNCIYKRLPGCGAIFMVYDKSDRLILSQDGNQRKRKQDQNMEWTATKYDNLGRVIYTGIMYRTENDTLQYYQSIRDIFKNELVVDNYSTNNFDSCKPLTLNYYDNYSFIVSPTTLGFVAKPGFDSQYTLAKGLLTGTRTYTLDYSNKSSISVIYYDYCGRTIQTRSENHLEGFDYTYNSYNHSGQLIKSLKEHSISSTIDTPISELYTNTYDHAGRLLTTWYVLNSNPPVLLVDNSASDAYDELGRLRTKKRHSGADIEKYDYNIRNWTTRIQSGAFVENLYYNSVPQGVINAPCFNGNIAFSTWTYNGVTNKYGYSYDNLNMLTGSTSYDSSNQPNGWYTETFGYDKMGNITTLGRMGASGPIDALTLTYNGNQLKKVDDFFGSQNQYAVKEYNNRANQPIEFTYDVNGNMVTDLDRDIVTIRYNILNLPDIIQFKNGNQIQNTYDASGRKLSSRYFTVVSYTTQPIISVGKIYDISDMVQLNDEIYVDGDDYIGNIEYGAYSDFYYGELNDSYNWLKRVSNTEGYVDNFYYPIYNYFRRDHLGNNREVWQAPWSYGSTNIAATTIQYTQYYPSGLPWAEGTGQDVQNRKYNGKEFMEMHGYDTYDYGARGYYPAMGRFTTIDRLSEKYYSISPYAYCAGNPVNRIDINGDSINAEQKESQQMIINTLTSEDAKYVQFNEDGDINMELLLSHTSESGNFNNLVTMATSDIWSLVSLDDKYTFKDNNGNFKTYPMIYQKDSGSKDVNGSTTNGTSTGEGGNMGVALLPGKGKSGVNSPDGNIHIILNKNLSKEARAEMFSHEGFGHALMYVNTKSRTQSGHIIPPSGGWKDINKPLIKMIIRSKMETVKNMRTR